MLLRESIAFTKQISVLRWARAHLANSEPKKAKAEAERAMQMSKEMGYHWGQVGAEEVLEEIE